VDLLEVLVECLLHPASIFFRISHDRKDHPWTGRARTTQERTAARGCLKYQLRLLHASSFPQIPVLVMAVEQNAFRAGALKMGIARHAYVIATSAPEPVSSVMTNHYFELAAFHAVGATSEIGHEALGAAESSKVGIKRGPSARKKKSTIVFVSQRRRSRKAINVCQNETNVLPEVTSIRAQPALGFPPP
jgi:hypothetical protein